jgi:hypothetical protein
MIAGPLLPLYHGPAKPAISETVFSRAGTFFSAIQLAFNYRVLDIRYLVLGIEDGVVLVIIVGDVLGVVKWIGDEFLLVSRRWAPGWC